MKTELISRKQASEVFNLSKDVFPYYAKMGYIKKVNDKYCKKSITDYLESISVKNLDGEVWKQAKGFSRYLFSSFGRVQSLNHRGGLHKRIVNPAISAGYNKTVFLDDNGKYRSINVHRLICLAFYPNENYLNLEVNHKDADKLNNEASNLEWCTRQENIQHSIENKLQTPFRGEEVGTSILKENDVLLIRKIAKERGRRYDRKDLGLTFNISPATIKDIVLRHTWKHI
jgi:hypothetical protein